MKKTLYVIMASTLALASCSSSVTNSEPVAKQADIKHICVKDLNKPAIANIGQYLANSLQKKGFTAEVSVNPSANCKYVLAYSLREENNLILRAKVRLSEVNNGSRTALGEVSYKQRGNEKEFVKVSGVQGQTDRIINELFKNY
ncbi:hypothetical protein [Lonepinella sp. MS14436]|uniref:hypothetical protein n=1 Tax=Lonepinella sp. MS14436 TaxID=3003619 RepID=UPI0036DB9ED1